MKNTDLLTILAAAVAVWFIVKKMPAGAKASPTTNAPDMLDGNTNGWVQEGNTMYSPDGWYYSYDKIHGTWSVVGQWDPQTGRKLN